CKKADMSVLEISGMIMNRVRHRLHTTHTLTQITHNAHSYTDYTQLTPLAKHTTPTLTQHYSQLTPYTTHTLYTDYTQLTPYTTHTLTQITHNSHTSHQRRATDEPHHW